MDMELGLKIKKTKEEFSKSIKVNKDRSPLFESKETETLYILVGYLSGFQKENVAVMIGAVERLITVSGVKYVEEMGLGKWGVYSKNIEPRRFRKVFRIPRDADIDMSNARFDDEEQILRVFMPKTKPGEFTGISIEEAEDGVSQQGVQDITIDASSKNKETGLRMDGDKNTEAMEEKADPDEEEGQSEFAPTETYGSDLNDEEGEEMDEAQKSEKQVEHSPTDEETQGGENHPTDPSENHGQNDSERMTDSRLGNQNGYNDFEEILIRNRNHDTESIEDERDGSKEASSDGAAKTNSETNEDRQNEHNNLDGPQTKIPRFSPSIEDQGTTKEEILRKEQKRPDSVLPSSSSRQTDKQISDSDDKIMEKERNEEEIGQPESDDENRIQTIERAGDDMTNTEISDDPKDDGRREQMRQVAKDQSTQTPAWPRRRCSLCSPWLYVGSTLVALVMVVMVHLSRKRK